MSSSLVNTKAYKRLELLFDNGEFEELDALLSDGVVCGFGTVGGNAVYAFSQNVEASLGAIGVKQCKKINKLYSLAGKTGCPIVGIYDSNGVKLDEGFEVINEYGELVKSSASLSGVVPQIAVAAGACLGTSALIAGLADVVIALKDADFYVTAPSEITVDDSAAKGAADIVAESFEDAVKSVNALLSLLPANNLDSTGFFEIEEPSVVVNENMTANELIGAICDGGISVELKAEYAKEAVTVLSSVGGQPSGVICFNGVALTCAAEYKAEAFIKLCDAFNIPIITIADNNGIERNNEPSQLVSAVKLASAYAGATCPKISLVTKNSIGLAYVLLAGKGANADITIAWENAVISPLETDSAVAFLYSDRLAAGEDRELLMLEYKKSLASAEAAAEDGAVDEIISPGETRAKLISSLDILSGKREITIARKHSVK